LKQLAILYICTHLKQNVIARSRSLASENQYSPSIVEQDAPTGSGSPSSLPLRWKVWKYWKRSLLWIRIKYICINCLELLWQFFFSLDKFWVTCQYTSMFLTSVFSWGQTF